MTDFNLSKPLILSSMEDFISINLRAQPCGYENCRVGELLNLSLRFATQLLKAEDEYDLFATVLVAVTAAEGLGFNRAFIWRRQETRDAFKAVVALGPASPEEAASVWRSLEEKRPSFEEMVKEARQAFQTGRYSLAALVKDFSFSFPSDLLAGQGAILLKAEEHVELRPLFEKLGVSEAACAPLNVPPGAYGFIWVDNFVTKRPILEEDLRFLETIAVLASMALHRLLVCEELNRQKHLLVEAEKLSAIGELSSKIFHEIRNPVSALGGLSKLLLRKRIPEDLEAYLKTMVKEAERLERVLEDLFEFVRPIELQKEPVRLCRLLQTALTLFLSSFKEAGIHVSLQSEGGDPIVLVDPKEMQLVFIHLIKNALEAMPEGGELKIILEIKDGVLVRIIDSGTGIPKNFLKRVTEPFFTTKTYGSGLGLSVAKKIVEMHGGTLTLKAAQPVGTEVQVYLPAALLLNGRS